MKRLGLVLFVCLCLQVSGISMPFAHLHADADHATTHHDGRAAHRHIAAHQPAVHSDDHHHDEPTTTTVGGADEAASLDGVGESEVGGVGGTGARLSHPTVSPSPLEVQFLAARPPGHVVAPPTDVGWRVPRSPDISSSSLRGPPR